MNEIGRKQKDTLKKMLVNYFQPQPLMPPGQLPPAPQMPPTPNIQQQPQVWWDELGRRRTPWDELPDTPGPGSVTIL